MYWVVLGAVSVAVALLIVRWGKARKCNVLVAGSPAPRFVLESHEGTNIDSAELKGSWYVIYFYPMDDTPGCTLEACAFRDHSDALDKLGVRVLGVSTDDIASHRAFAEKYALNFDLLADPDGLVVRRFGVKAPVGGIALRISYLVDGEGMIRKVYPKVDVKAHAKQIAEDYLAFTEGA